MKLFILSATLLCVLCAYAPAQAQPALQPSSLTPPSEKSSTLPDLSPETLQPVKPDERSPLVNEGESVIAPSMEPWRESKPKRQSGKTAEEVFVTLPYQVQNLILEESDKVNNDCHNYDLYSQFHDCECLGSRYFEERVFSPEENKDTIVSRISSECASIPGVAGFGYEQCVSSMRYMLVPARTDDFCTCFANKLAENYKFSPSPDFDHLRALSAQTNAYCLRTVPSAIKNLP